MSMSHMTFKSVQPIRVAPDITAPTIYSKAAGTTDVLQSNTIDMAGATSIAVTIAVGAITATGTVAVKLQGSTDDVTYVDITGATQTFVAADAQKFRVIEVFKPAYRYIQVTSTRATANAVIDSIYAYLNHVPNQAPAVHATQAAAGTFLNNP